MVNRDDGASVTVLDGKEDGWSSYIEQHGRRKKGDNGRMIRRTWILLGLLVMAVLFTSILLHLRKGQVIIPVQQ